MNENLQRLLPNPFATDYTGKIADETMVDLYTEKELEKFAKSIIIMCVANLYLNGYDDAAYQLNKVLKELEIGRAHV